MKYVKSEAVHGVLLAALLANSVVAVRADVTAKLDINLTKKGVAIPPSFGGLMTEEINHSYDGGLFAELIQNRTFQDPSPRQRPGSSQGAQNGLPIHWSKVGNCKVSTDRTNPVNAALPVNLRLDLEGGTGGVANDGYWGVPIRPNTRYTANFYARGTDGFSGPITASLMLDDGDVVIAKTETQPISNTWQMYKVTIKSSSKAPVTTKARFVLSASGTGSVSFSLVSLFPPTYKKTPNGLRPDLMKLMADLHPAFIRLPGGNYVEGSTFPTRFNWKQMVGPASARPGHMGCWGYRSSDGFGIPEYLLWCKQLKAEPVLAVFAGYVLNGNHVDAGSPEMEQYTQEALEEIEYISGPASSKWGRVRAADGFPKPFDLHYVEIGNEDWFDRSGSYDGRFTQMAKAIRAKYPNLKIIATAPVKSFQPDLIDDHFYRSARQLLTLGRQYDPPTGNPAPLSFSGGGSNGRQPNGMKTFVGEWATQEGRPTPTLNAGLADAAFIMALEQNADAIPLECYAPLFVNVNMEDSAKGYPRAWQWGTNLIGYDALTSFGSPSFYAQSMLAKNRGDFALNSALQIAPAAPETAPEPHGAIGVGSWHTNAEYRDISVTSPDGSSLLTVAPAQNTNAWQTIGSRFAWADGAIHPINGDSESWAITGDPKWTNYTIRLRARKKSGAEGFIVLFNALDGNNYQWWNIGGWGNTVARCEVAANGDRTPYGPGVPFVVETDRWYDLRLEVTGNRVRGFIDNKLVTNTRIEQGAPPVSAIATATYSSKDHAVFVKVVNPGNNAVNMAIQISGAGMVNPKGEAIVLSGDLTATNSVEQPMKIAPVREVITDASTSFSRNFLPHSFTLLKLSVK